MVQMPSGDRKSSCSESLTPERRAKIAAQLETEYIYSETFYHGQQIKSNWQTYNKSQMLRLDDPVKKNLQPWRLRTFTNKPTALYWMPSAQDHGFCSLYPFACLYKAWYRYHGNDPNFDHGYFWANPIQITKSGPKTIAEILNVHKSFCNQTSSLLEQLEHEQDGAAEKSYQSPWLSPKDYGLLPLCRALLVILDALPEYTNDDPSLDRDVHIQTVLLVRTGNEDGLSAPIEFDTIMSKSLPLERSDADHNVIRVPLSTAITFVLDLQRREEQAFPELRILPSGRKYKARKYANDLVRQADQVGIEMDDRIKQALKRVEEEQGKESEFGEFDFWLPSWQ